LVVVARMVYRGTPVMAPVNDLLVALVWTEVSFLYDQSFSNKTSAVIGAFDVDRVREELVINLPWIPTLEVWISMFAAFTDWAQPVNV